MATAPKYATWVLAVLLSAVFAPARAEDNLANVAPAEIVRQAVNNEISSNQNAGMHFRFKDQKRTPLQLKVREPTRRRRFGARSIR